ncbi:MAG: ribonuclease H-like domain-containing protein, partial [Thermofilum sp.]|uniref:ribonuclease H-like domain-containing protein n=1 Tax=Thermofilum sp. TaxID=1961369 RepID=UPI00317C62CE
MEREVGEAWILRSLRLLYGIGETRETRLRLAGYTTLRDLLSHPRWAWQVEQILQAVERRDISALNRLVARWFPLSHPIALSLLGFVDPEEILFLDIETLGLYTEAIILIGLVHPKEGALVVRHLVVREMAEELPALLALAEELETAKALVTYNGRAFDVNFIQARLRYYGLPFEVEHPNFDLLPFARRYFREFLPNCRLETVEKALAVERTINIPSALVPEF